jgi:PAS domain S-box-containing protein
VHDMELHRRTKAGDVLLCRMTAFRVTIGGRPHSLFQLHDITREKATELALRDSEELFSKVFRGSPHPMVVAEVETKAIVEVNSRFCDFIGRPRENLVGHTTSEFRSWIDVADRDAIYAEVARRGSVAGRVVQLRDASGDLRLGRFSGELIEYRGRKCVVSIFEDTTDIVRAEQALRVSE